ncbi:unnamed protein product [Caenorhabditis bovis]|uniref:Phlebovirus glycoprotein G2 fusion domain-containing protein n=1 Tax=Caenorhabditis bovis TaxID=2654633 RepID=A0A8S1ENQ3_9PELO|nr:unnamed protein product [Caenorhabditis bovis]
MPRRVGGPRSSWPNKNIPLRTTSSATSDCRDKMTYGYFMDESIRPLIYLPHGRIGELFVLDIHERHGHASTSYTLAAIREIVWITQGRSYVMKILTRCRQSKESVCIRQDDCTIKDVATTHVRPNRTTACFELHDASGNLAYTVQVRAISIVSYCNQETVFYSRDYTLASESSHRCAHEGSCSANKCQTTKVAQPGLPLSTQKCKLMREKHDQSYHNGDWLLDTTNPSPRSSFHSITSGSSRRNASICLHAVSSGVARSANGWNHWNLPVRVPCRCPKFQLSVQRRSMPLPKHRYSNEMHVWLLLDESNSE